MTKPITAVALMSLWEVPVEILKQSVEINEMQAKKFRKKVNNLKKCEAK